MIKDQVTFLFLLVCYAHSSNRRIARNTDKSKTYALAGLFPVSKHAGVKSSGSTDGGGVCEDFANDGWYMLLAMDFAIEQINAHPDYDFTLESIKIDTCGIDTDKDFWVHHFMNVLNNEDYNITGVVGASYSDNSKIAAHASTMYDIPMISYQSSSTSISDTLYFPLFFRTIPIDDLQTIALKTLLVQLNLTYIALFYDRNQYGTGLKEMLDQDQRGHEKICILDGGFPISDQLDPKDIDRVTEEGAIKAIAVFGYPDDIEKVQKAFESRNRSVDEYIWIASDGWAQFDTDPGMRKVIGTTFSASILAGFSEFYNRTMANLAAGAGQYHQDDQTPGIYTRFKNMDNSEMAEAMGLSTEDKINYITPVVEAVFAFAEALNNKTQADLKERLIHLNYNVSKVFKLKRSTLNTGHPGKERLTYGANSYGAYSYSAYRLSSTTHVRLSNDNGALYKGAPSAEDTEPWTIGSWHKEGETEAPNIIQEQLRGLLDSWEMTQTSSECQKCRPGWIQDTVSNQCCYECVQCDTVFQFTRPNDPSTCYNCSDYQQAWDNRTGCGNITLIQISYADPLESAILVLSSVGIICVSVTYWYMFVYTYTPIARASGRSYMLLVAICTCLIFASPLVLFACPSDFICMVQRVVVAGPTVGIIAACLVRTFSIDRIFRHPGVRQRLLSKRLVLMTIGFLIVIELFIESIIIVSMPSVPKENIIDPHKTRMLECEMPNEDILLTFIFPGMLTVICGVFALRIRKVPSNYNESRYILFTITIMTFESLIFFMSFKSLDYRQYIRYSVTCIIVGDFMTYFCLFIPRLYIILFKPERNTLHLQCSANGQFLMAKTVDRGCNTSFSIQEDGLDDCGTRLCSSDTTDDETMTKITLPEIDQRISTL